MVKNLFNNAQESRAWNLNKRVNKYPLFKELMGVFQPHKNEVVLDYGCGPANDLIWLAEEGQAKKVIGLDVSQKALSQAQHRIKLHNLKNVVLKKVSDESPKIPLKDNSVDFINCGGVLHHVSYPGKVLQEFYRVLKPGGTARIMVYNRDSLHYHIWVAYEKMIVNPKFRDTFGKMSLKEAFSKSTDSVNCPKSVCYSGEEFVKICENIGFYAKFLGGYFIKRNIKLYNKYKDIAINDKRLNEESRQFIKEVDNTGPFPKYKGKYCGWGGSYILRKIFTKKPSKTNNIYNFIKSNDDYIDDYEQKSCDKKGDITLETKILKNLCQILINNSYDKNILDIGCGNGHILNNINSKNKVATDISFNQLENINDDSIKVRCNAENIPINTHFDYIICTDVFEHVQNPDKLVNEIYRLLKPNGELLFSVPWKQDLSIYNTEEYKQKYGKYKYVHLRSVDEKTIEQYFLNRFDVLNETEIDAIKPYMTLKPYSIKFFHMKRR